MGASSFRFLELIILITSLLENPRNVLSSNKSLALRLASVKYYFGIDLEKCGVSVTLFIGVI
jgi:hypothetical protein